VSFPRKPNAPGGGVPETPTPDPAASAPAPRSPDFGLEDPYPPGYGDAARRGNGGGQRSDSGPLDTAPVRSPRAAPPPLPTPVNRPERDRDTSPRGTAEARETPRRDSGSWAASLPRDPRAARSVRDVREARESRDPREPQQPQQPQSRRPPDMGGRDRPGEGRPPDPYAALREAREPHTPRITDSMFDRFGWRLPEEEAAEQPPRPTRPANSAHWEEREERIRLEESGQIPRITPNGPYNPYASGMFDPLAPANNDAPPLDANAPYSAYSQPFHFPTGETGTAVPPLRASDAPLSRSGTFRALDPASLPAAPYSSGSSGVTRSGRFLTTRTATGSFVAVPPMTTAPASTANAAANAEPLPSPLVTDRVVLLFFGLTLALVGAMAAFIALRFDSLPAQIVLHFGPGGPSQPDRIGDRQELWTIPFLAFIVFVANTALASVFDFFDRRDRFVPRLLLLGSTLVAAVAWVVLLTLLNRPVASLVP